MSLTKIETGIKSKKIYQIVDNQQRFDLPVKSEYYEHYVNSVTNIVYEVLTKEEYYTNNVLTKTIEYFVNLDNDIPESRINTLTFLRIGTSQKFVICYNSSGIPEIAKVYDSANNSKLGEIHYYYVGGSIKASLLFDSSNRLYEIYEHGSNGSPDYMTELWYDTLTMQPSATDLAGNPRTISESIIEGVVVEKRRYEVIVSNKDTMEVTEKDLLERWTYTYDVKETTDVAFFETWRLWMYEAQYWMQNFADIALPNSKILHVKTISKFIGESENPNEVIDCYNIPEIYFFSKPELFFADTKMQDYIRNVKERNFVTEFRRALMRMTSESSVLNALESEQNLVSIDVNRTEGEPSYKEPTSAYADEVTKWINSIYNTGYQPQHEPDGKQWKFGSEMVSLIQTYKREFVLMARILYDAGFIHTKDVRTYSGLDLTKDEHYDVLGVIQSYEVYDYGGISTKTFYENTVELGFIIQEIIKFNTKYLISANIIEGYVYNYHTTGNVSGKLKQIDIYKKGAGLITVVGYVYSSDGETQTAEIIFKKSDEDGKFRLKQKKYLDTKETYKDIFVYDDTLSNILKVEKWYYPDKYTSYNPIIAEEYEWVTISGVLQPRILIKIEKILGVEISTEKTQYSYPNQDSLYPSVSYVSTDGKLTEQVSSLNGKPRYISDYDKNIVTELEYYNV